MSNKINPTHHGIVGKTDHKVSGSGQGAKVQPGGSADASKSTGKTATSDTVELTDRVRLLERLEKAVAELPAIDRARVEAVKADIANGKYQIDVDNIADILLRTDLDLGD